MMQPDQIYVPYRRRHSWIRRRRPDIATGFLYGLIVAGVFIVVLSLLP